MARKKLTVEQIRRCARLLEWLESDREAYDEARDRRLPPFEWYKRRRTGQTVGRPTP
jgi:hypothetical protein